MRGNERVNDESACVRERLCCVSDLHLSVDVHASVRVGAPLAIDERVYFNGAGGAGEGAKAEV